MTQTNSRTASRIASLVAAAALAGGVAVQATAQQTTQQNNQQQAPETYVAATHGDWTVRCAGSDPSAETQSQDDDGKGDLQAGEEQSASEQQSASEEQSETVAPPNCVMVQIAHHSEQEDIGISVIVVRQKINNEVVSQMRITTPISVFLPAGVGLEIDGAAIGRLPYEVCSPAGVCVATVFVDEELEGKLKRGGEAKFYLKDVRGTDGLFGLSLSGFTAAFDQLAPS